MGHPISHFFICNVKLGSFHGRAVYLVVSVARWEVSGSFPRTLLEVHKRQKQYIEVVSARKTPVEADFGAVRSFSVVAGQRLRISPRCRDELSSFYFVVVC
jgi:hypothetical protein